MALLEKGQNEESSRIEANLNYTIDYTQCTLANINATKCEKNKRDKQKWSTNVEIFLTIVASIILLVIILSLGGGICFTLNCK